ncbi:MAG: hypothetical protein FWE45_03920 [Firmicutes bacterium]|nr:hypothetical protein [Bacillota bacterium]
MQDFKLWLPYVLDGNKVWGKMELDENQNLIDYTFKIFGADGMHEISHEKA